MQRSVRPNNKIKRVILDGYIAKVKRSGFLKSVSTLAAGTVLSQAILFGSSPFLTRIYTPADFGLMALFTSISSLVAILTTGRYELAAGLPEKDEEAVNVVLLAVGLSAVVSFSYYLIIFGLRQINIPLLNNSQLLHQSVVFLIPVYTFLAANYSALIYWNQRTRSYVDVSRSSVVQAAVTTAINIILGMLGVKLFGLIYGLTFGQLGGNLYLIFKFLKKDRLKDVSIAGIKAMAVKYVEFPKYMIFSGLLLTTTQQIVPIIFSFLFSATVVGLFSLSNRMLRIPNIVLTNSIGNVFRNDAIDKIREDGNCERLYVSTLKKLTILSIPIFLLLWIIAPLLFTLFFGKDWEAAGYFARIMCVMLTLDFVASPLSTLFYVIGKQRAYMRIQLFNTVLGIAGLWAGAYFFNSAYLSVTFFTVANCIMSSVTILLTYKYSKENYKL